MVLRKLDNRCFYCQTPVREESDVDHFVPFSLYPRDLIHNFVLAHPSCNRSKSNSLAARPHLERWTEYIDRHDNDLMEIAEAAGRLGNVVTCRMVARWGYTNAAQSGGQAWLRKNTFGTRRFGLPRLPMTAQTGWPFLQKQTMTLGQPRTKSRSGPGSGTRSVDWGCAFSQLMTASAIATGCSGNIACPAPSSSTSLTRSG